MGKFLIIEAVFYQDVSGMLLRGATGALEENNIEYDVLTVPGALEIPLALQFSMKKKYDAYIVLGCVIRGETAHYDIVCNESARGVYDIAMANNLPLGNSILTVESKEQAIVRADPKQKNKGGDAAMAAISLLKIKNNK